MRFPLHTLLLGLFLAACVLLAPYANAQQENDVSPEAIAAEFVKNGEKIQLHITDFPGVFVDGQGRQWIFEAREQTLADRLADMRKQGSAWWEERGQFKLATQEQVSRFLKENPMQQTKVQGVFVDARGDRWIFVPDEKNLSDLSKGRYARIEYVTPDEMFRSFSGSKGLNPGVISTALESAKAYGPEQLRFSAALWMVQMGTCFGGFGNILFQSSTFTPTCVDDFIHHLTTPQGLIGFYFFILTNRLSNKIFTNILLAAASFHSGKMTVAVLKARVTPWLGYIGMALGGIASNAVSFVLSPPTWEECIKHVSGDYDHDGNLDPGETEIIPYEGYSYPACKEAFMNFQNLPTYLKDTPGESLEMITAGLLAAATQHIYRIGLNAVGTNAMTTLPRGLLLLGVSGEKAIGAGINVFRTVQVISNVAMIGGVPGVIAKFVFATGTYVVFIAWDNIIRAPFMATYHALVEHSKIGDSVVKIDQAIQKTVALNLEKSWLRMDCHRVTKPIPWGEGPAYPTVINIPYAPPVVVFNNVEIKSECETIAPLDVELARFQTAVAQYRDASLMTYLTTATTNWSHKTSAYFNRYRASKLMLEYIYAGRTLEAHTHMDVWQMAVYFMGAWREALRIDVNDDSPGKIEILKRFAVMDQLVYKIEEMEAAQNESTNGELYSYLNTAYYYVRDMMLMFRNQKSEREQLKILLLDVKKYIEESGGNIATSPSEPQYVGFGMDPNRHRRLFQTYQEFIPQDFTTLPTEASTALGPSNSEFYNTLISQLGEEDVANAAYDLFCGSEKDFKFSNLNDNGRGATMRSPFILKNIGSEATIQEYYFLNCSELSQSIRSLPEGEFAKTWYFQGRRYTDPLSMAIDIRTELIAGNSTIEAFNWWKEKAFPTTMEFIISAAYDYHSNLKKEINYHIPKQSPESLLNESRPTSNNVGDYSGYIAPRFFWENGRLSRTLMSQTQFILQMVKNTRPGDKNIERLADKVALDMAKTILSFSNVEGEGLLELYSKLRVDLAKLELTEYGAATNLQTFQEAMSGVMFSRQHRMVFTDAMTGLNKSTNELYKALTGASLESINGLDTKRYTQGIPAAQLYNFSKAEYKKYMYYKLLHENIRGIAIDYLTLDLYRKFSLQPLLSTQQE